MDSIVRNWISSKRSTFTKVNSFNEYVLDEFIFSLKGVFFPRNVKIFKQNYALMKKNYKKLLKQVKKITGEALNINILAADFILELPKIDLLLKSDLEAIYDGDPACKLIEEIILCYPGFFAIFIYRIAHALYEQKILLLPRIMTEYAHSKTGIDIHPGATIGHHFMIDHGTGIVIGETTVIGNYVKIYQGVTLGALSLKAGQRLKGIKRHPTISDGVTIYSSASIFGGQTIIGPNVTIKSNAFITSSIYKEDL